MALTFLGNTSFTQCGPEQWSGGQYELDKLNVPFCGSVTGLTTYISSLTRGAAWSGDGNMFLTGWQVSDSNKRYPTVTLEYIGANGGTLPDIKKETTSNVASATTNTSSLIYPVVATNPATVQFYSITNTITLYNNSDESGEEPDDPPEVSNVITWDLGFGLQPGFNQPDLINFLLTSAFSQAIIEPDPEVECVVTGKYWKITKRKTRTLFPYAPP